MHNMSNNMSNNMQNMQKCWEGLLQSYQSYFAYHATPILRSKLLSFGVIAKKNLGGKKQKRVF